MPPAEEIARQRRIQIVLAVIAIIMIINNEVAAPVVAAMSKATAEEKEKVREKVFERIQRMNPDGGAKLHFASHLIMAVK